MSKHAPILAAEDNETDGLLLRIALKGSGLPNPLIIARDGQEAVDYLHGTGPHSDRITHPLPGLLLLDLNMPRLTGLDVLAWLATRPELQHLPVVLLSSSLNQQDIEKAQQLGARDYLVKPHDYQLLTQMLLNVAGRWLIKAPQTS